MIILYEEYLDKRLRAQGVIKSVNKENTPKPFGLGVFSFYRL